MTSKLFQRMGIRGAPQTLPSCDDDLERQLSADLAQLKKTGGGAFAPSDGSNYSLHFSFPGHGAAYPPNFETPPTASSPSEPRGGAGWTSAGPPSAGKRHRNITRDGASSASNGGSHDGDYSVPRGNPLENTEYLLANLRPAIRDAVEQEIEQFREHERKFYQDPGKRKKIADDIARFLLGPWRSVLGADWTILDRRNPLTQQNLLNPSGSPALTSPASAPVMTAGGAGVPSSGLERMFGSLDEETFFRKLALGGKNSLTNMGNTCFLNTGLQCLAHLEPLVAFFLTGRFKAELNFDAKYGSKEATLGIGFAEMLLRLWSSPSFLLDKQEEKLRKSAKGSSNGVDEGYGPHASAAELVGSNSPPVKRAEQLAARAVGSTSSINLERDDFRGDRDGRAGSEPHSPMSPGDLSSKVRTQTLSTNAKRTNTELTVFIARGSVTSYVEYKPQRYLRKLGGHNKDLFAEKIELQQEQDVQELIAWLLDVLHEDLNLVKSGESPVASIPRPVKRAFRQEDLLKIENEFGSEAAAALCWARNLTNYRGIIVDTFQGQLRSTVTCSRCKTFSRSYEPFLTTSLPINGGNRKSGLNIMQGSSSSSKRDKEEMLLMDALRAFSVEESLDTHWYCPNCRQKVPARKKIEFWKLPFVFVLHLKRFEYDQAKRKWNKNCVKLKSQTPIDLAEIETSANPNYLSVDDETGNSGDRCVYDIVCSANHVGNDIETGHYTATCRHPINKTYYYFDDDETQKDREDRVVSQNSYVLFLVRRTNGILPRQELTQPQNWPHQLDEDLLRFFPALFDRLSENAAVAQNLEKKKANGKSSG
ncbi:unnamed protein product [Amoebophrya sp. A25]|nr:unnamed protein product [Amoebophrya sp. A25]|eukprot:GSA25T00000303001.1